MQTDLSVQNGKNNPCNSQQPVAVDEFAPLPAHLAKKIDDLLHTPNWMGLALHLPLRFEDPSTLTEINQLEAGQKANVIATVTHHEVLHRPRKQLKITVQDQDKQLVLRWLHCYPGQAEKMPLGARLKISGQVRASYSGCYEIVHPQVTRLLHSEADNDASSTRTATTHPPVTTSRSNTATTPNTTHSQLEPIYPSRSGLKQSEWRYWMKQLPNSCFEDTLSHELCRSHQLMPWQDTLKLLHGQAQPHALMALNDRSHPAWDRVKLDELLAQQLLLKQFRETKQSHQALALNQTDSTLLHQFIQKLGFQLTQAQQRAFNEIRYDLAQGSPMQRLLQGDVGSGKTIVAALACVHAVASNAQAAIAAPTEILAQQHFNKLQPLFNTIGIKVVLLHGRLKAKEKNQIIESIQSGQAQIVIGTHALFQDSITFKQLGFVVLDEQHRFGVAQRLNLISKANNNQLAHQLMMSATPIPRTLAQTYLADLTVSYLNEKPPGRKPIITKLLAHTKREQLIQAIQSELQQGQQVYWVCPLIEESEKLDLQAAQTTAEELTSQLANHQVALLHSKLDIQTKQTIMQLFTQNKIHVLVSTTVIEVGVDVPNASLMVIDQAERFGLAQLHQLRGRVGRGSLQSTCILLYGTPLSQTAKTRLKAMHQSNDGFYLAEIDLQIRGPGDLLGKRQSGLPELRYANPMTDQHLIALARKLAAQTPTPHIKTERHIQRWLTSTPWWLS